MRWKRERKEPIGGCFVFFLFIGKGESGGASEKREEVVRLFFPPLNRE